MKIKNLIVKYSSELQELENYTYQSKDWSKTVIEDYNVKLMEKFGGHEGAGEETWKVFAFEKDGLTKFYKVPGFYQSHEGSEYEYDDAFEVFPEQKVVDIWSPVK